MKLEDAECIETDIQYEKAPVEDQSNVADEITQIKE